MNKDLIKKRVEPGLRQKRYMKKHQTLCVTLSKEKDKDIIGWLDRQENKSASVRHVLRKEAQS